MGDEPPVAGSVLRRAGVRAQCRSVTPLVDPDGRVGLVPAAPPATRHEMTGTVELARSYRTGEVRGAKCWTEFVLVVDVGRELRVLGDIETTSFGVEPGARVTAVADLSLVADYEWDAFALPDVRADWRVRHVVDLGGECLHVDLVRI